MHSQNKVQYIQILAGVACLIFFWQCFFAEESSKKSTGYPADFASNFSLYCFNQANASHPGNDSLKGVTLKIWEDSIRGICNCYTRGVMLVFPWSKYSENSAAYQADFTNRVANICNADTGSFYPDTSKTKDTTKTK